jgi:hypothetical protein
MFQNPSPACGRGGKLIGEFAQPRVETMHELVSFSYEASFAAEVFFSNNIYVESPVNQG